MTYLRAVVLVGVLAAGALRAELAPDFTIVALPDTQKYAQKFPATFVAQADWIIANRTNLNIQYVAHLGDITEDGDRNPKEWQVATNALYRLLNAGIPLGVVPGNHDHYGGVNLYDAFFGAQLFEGRRWYGGNLGGNNRNHYDLFRVGDLDFMVLFLDFYYKDLDYRPIDAWASSVLASNAQRRTILVSHNILAVSGDFDARGREIYDLAKTHTNVFLMLCGHNHGQARRFDTFNGHTIHTCLSDFQSGENGGNGFLRLYRFAPRENVIRVQTYSPTLDQYLTDEASQFEIPYRMNPDAPLPTGTPIKNVRVNAKPKPQPSPTEKPVATFVPAGATWRYLDTGKDPGAEWTAPSFDDTGWQSGRAELGYGDSNETTVVNFGADPKQRHITTWFRHSFVVTNLTGLTGIRLQVLRDDGVAVYLNGTGIFTNNLPGTFTAGTTALKSVAGAEETKWLTSKVPVGLLRAGTNLLAAEIHQSSPDSSDISFDLELVGTGN